MQDKGKTLTFNESFNTTYLHHYFTIHNRDLQMRPFRWYFIRLLSLIWIYIWLIGDYTFTTLLNINKNINSICPCFQNKLLAHVGTHVSNIKSS